MDQSEFGIIAAENTQLDLLTLLRSKINQHSESKSHV